MKNIQKLSFHEKMTWQSAQNVKEKSLIMVAWVIGDTFILKKDANTSGEMQAVNP